MSLINVKNLTFAYEGSYDNIFDDVCFQIDTDWKLGFTGRNGRGKRPSSTCCLGNTSMMERFTPTSILNIFRSPYATSQSTRWTS